MVVLLGCPLIMRPSGKGILLPASRFFGSVYIAKKFAVRNETPKMEVPEFDFLYHHK